MKKFLSISFLMALVVLQSCKKEAVEQTTTSKLLHATRGNNPGMYDAQGRFMVLRGVNYNVLGDYWQANPAVPTTKSYQVSDLEMMASYGFNCVRLLFSWSKLEPQPGVYDQAYIQSIQTIIEDAAKLDMYVMLDMHQDAWGKYIATPIDSACAFPNKGWDGAPQWATLTDGASYCTVNGSRESAPAVYHAFQNFWDNTNGIQTNCINAWKHLVQATCTYENVLGYDLFNEPSLGYKDPESEQLDKFTNFYRDLTNAIRSVEGANQHIIFMENAIQYKGNGYIGLPDPGFTNDQNLVAAPHHYFESIGNLPFTIEQGYAMLQTVVQDFQTTLFIGEWGYFGNPSDDASKVKRFCAVEDANFGSSTWWQWAQSPGDPHSMSYDGLSFTNPSMHLIELDQTANFTGNKNDIFLKILARPHPIAIVGKPVSLDSDSDTGLMNLSAEANNEGITTLWIPGVYGSPKISGENVLSHELKTVPGGYIASVQVKGNYTIHVNY